MRGKKKNEKELLREDNAIILDYLSQGYVNSKTNHFDGRPVAQAIGVEHFMLLELFPQEGVDLDLQEKVYIGSDKKKRDKIKRVNRRLNLDNLSKTASLELDYAIQDIVKANEEKYVDFFNNSQGVSLRKHSLELLPGIGKKHMLRIIEAREKKPFESFDDIVDRVTGIINPGVLVANRIKQELDITRADKNKYYLFVKDPRSNE